MSDHELLDNGDAQFWAQEFLRIRKARLAEDGFDIADDEGTLIGWFANAFQRGEWNSPHYKQWIDNYFRENKLGEYAENV